MTLDLHNFFKYYDDKNANHVAAVQWLEDHLPEKFMDDSETEWVNIFRTHPPAPAVLNVPYFNQVDNYRDAHRTCNSSSCAMCLAFLKPGSILVTQLTMRYRQKFWQVMVLSHTLVTVFLFLTLIVALMLGNLLLLVSFTGVLYLLLLAGTWL
jgi:inner membrane protein involved in colicin E2 resistance